MLERWDRNSKNFRGCRRINEKWGRKSCSEMIGQYSIVSEDVIIGEGSKVWHFCNLYGCRIGKNTQIGSYSEVKKDASIGDNCRLQARIFIPEGTRIDRK